MSYRTHCTCLGREPVLIGSVHAPFVLASVCTFWRQLAIDTASLWSYLGFPDGQVSWDFAELRVLRSKDAPVDIYFHPRSCWVGEGARCLAQLYALVPRWRDVDIDYPLYSAKLSLTWLVEHRTPYLRSLSLMSQVSSEEEVAPLAGVLPYAPHLKRMFVDDLAVNWTVHAGGLSALADLTIWLYEWDVNSLCSLLTQVAGTLQTLALLGKTARPNANADGIVVLPNLTGLTLHKPQWLRHIRAPNLKRLELSVADIQSNMVPLFTSFAEVQTLVLWGSMQFVDLRCLESLANVTHLRFSVPPGFYKIYGRDTSSTCQVGTVFLKRLASTEPPIWPLMRRISFGDDGDSLPHRVTVDHAGLSLLACRSCRATTGDEMSDAAVPASHIQLYAAPNVDSPGLHSFLEQLACVRPEVSLGAAIAAA